MSKIGRKPIQLPEGVSVTQEGSVITVACAGRTVQVPTLRLAAESTLQEARMNWGTMRSLLQNAVFGVVKDFTKTLEIEGIGFKVSLEGNVLVFSLGFSHPVRFTPPPDITFKVEKNAITISGRDKALVGATAAQIRSLRKPEPYQGKGIRYRGEVIRRKAGKKVGATTGTV